MTTASVGVAAEQVALYADALFDPENVVEVRLIRPVPGKDADIRCTWFTAATLADQADDIGAANADGWNVYLGANPRSAKGKKSDKAITFTRVLFVDFDGFTVEQAVAAWVKAGLPPATLIVNSGHGVHVYLLLDEPQHDLDAWKELQKDLAAMMGGDTTCSNPERIMRLPGFMNLKREPVPCEIISIDATRRGAFAEVRRLVPVRPTKVTPPANVTPIDPARVGNKLARCIAYMGTMKRAVSGDWGHNRFFNAGCLARRFGLTGREHWDACQWFSENMSDPPWSEKEIAHKVEETAAEVSEGSADFGCKLREKRDRDRPIASALQRNQGTNGNSTAHEPCPDLSDVRGEAKQRGQLGPVKSADDAPDPADVIDKPEPLRLAEHFRDKRCHDSDGRLTLRRFRQEWWRWNPYTGYRNLEDEGQDAELYEHLDRLWTPTLDKEGRPTGVNQKIVPRSALVREVRLALPGRGLFVFGEMPQWLDGRTAPEPTDVVAFRNGLLDAAAYCRERETALFPQTPEWFSGVACPYDFDPAATCPMWLAFLDQVFQGDAERVSLLQEWFGLNLVPDNRFEKLMVLVGLPRSGKGTTIETMISMLGGDQVAVTNFAKLASRFGLHPLVGRLAAVLPDAHLARSTDAKAALEVLKSISGNDDQAIDRKGIDELPRVHLPVRFTIGTNELPKLPDEAGALKPRLLLLYYGKSFEGEEDRGLKVRLRTEAPGVAVWALEGLARLRENGTFTEPAKCKAMVEVFEQLVSPVKAFVSEKCDIEVGGWMAKDVLYGMWAEWCRPRGEEPGTLSQFGMHLVGAYPTIHPGRRGPRGQQITTYEGVQRCE